MKCLRILPEIRASTLRWPARSTRNIVPGKTWVTVPSITICSSFGMVAKYIGEPFLSQILGRTCFCASEGHASACPGRAKQVPPSRTNANLADVFERDAWQIFAKLLTFPPRAGFAMFLHRRETVTIKRRPNIPRRTLRKRISLKQRRDFRFAVQ